MSEKIKILVVVGPTASGKTGLGIGLAKHFGGEIVSADSMQIYKCMPIASAAPTKEEKEEIPHHLVQFLEFTDSFTVADYVLAARERIFDIHKRGKLPIIVGGTGLYINSLIDGINFVEGKTDLSLRRKLEKEYDSIGAKAMLEKLKDFDEATAHRLHPNDKKRIIRAFELYFGQGTTVTKQNISSKEGENPFESVIIGINFKDRDKLYSRINKRVDLMSELGLKEEAEQTFKRNVTSGATQAIGHKELFPYFRGEITYEEALENLKQSTRRYAKRQLTWFRKDQRIYWIYADESKNILEEAINAAKEGGI